MTAKPDAPEPERSQTGNGSPRKVYRRPELSRYGDVSQVTRGGGGKMTNDAGGGDTRMCWISEALYGIDAPRTVLVRAWLRHRYARREAWALVAVPLYRIIGRPIARAIASSTLVRALVRPLFDRAVRLAHREYAAYATTVRMTTNPSA